MDINEMFNSILNKNRVVRLLDKLKNYHEETYEHCIRVGFLCMFLGEKNGFSREDVIILGYAGLLHDIGKLDISKNILNKKGSLNEDEREEIEKHSEKGFERLKDFEEIKDIVKFHHAYQKESYPKNCKTNDRILVLSQIVGIADMFDALSNERSYKNAFSNDKIKEILKKNFIGKKVYIEQVLEKNKDGEDN
ncbi:MAG: HD domain-containing protein [Candidatus Pacearchaeota archaeon]|nr:HD domain-containing protein [Candidatus Pacearchaeota archaeon]